MRSTIAHTLRRYGARADDFVVEDLESRVFLGLMVDDARKLRQYSGRASLQTWLRVRAVNVTIDTLRQRKQTVATHPTDGSEPYLDLIDPTPPADAKCARRQLIEGLRQFLSDLSDEDRRFAELFFGDELDYESIAKRTGATVGSLYARKNRIRKKLVARAREAGWFDEGERDHG